MMIQKIYLIMKFGQFYQVFQLQQLVLYIYFLFITDIQLLLNMSSDIECIYKSFQLSGSIYVANIPSNITLDQCNKHNLRAVVSLSPNLKPQPQNPSHYQLLHLPIAEDQKIDLWKHFESCFQFINRHRANTNILICSSSGKDICIVFLFAYLMRKYKYSLPYIIRLYQNTYLGIRMKGYWIEQLKAISKLFQTIQDDEDQKIMATTIGNRIRRIRIQYSNLAKTARCVSISKSKQLPFNPEVSTARKWASTSTQIKDDINSLQMFTVPKESKNVQRHSNHARRLSDLY